MIAMLSLGCQQHQWRSSLGCLELSFTLLFFQVLTLRPQSSHHNHRGKHYLVSCIMFLILCILQLWNIAKMMTMTTKVPSYLRTIFLKMLSLFFVCVCTHIYIYMCVWAHKTWCTCGGQKTWLSCFFPSHCECPETELKLWGSGASALTTGLPCCPYLSPCILFHILQCWFHLLRQTEQMGNRGFC